MFPPHQGGVGKSQRRLENFVEHSGK